MGKRKFLFVCAALPVLGMAAYSIMTLNNDPESAIIAEPIIVPVFTKQPVISSQRSRAAIAKTAPRLIAALRARDLEYGAPIFIRVFKKEGELEMWVRGKAHYELFRTYAIAAFSGTLGPKTREGDRQAPEGFYFVGPGGMNPNSRFHLSFNLGYPNAYDRSLGRTGSALMVHGSNQSIGCYAMTDAGIEEIYTLADAALRNGQPFFRVHCFPFRMTAANMRAYAGSRWISFWRNLKTGYDFFERRRVPPDVTATTGSYVFAADG